MKELIAQAKNDKQFCWAVGYIGKWILLFLFFILYTLLIARGAEAKAERKYEAWKLRFADSYTAQQLAAAEADRLTDPWEIQLDAESQMLARVLYGIKDNSSDDLKTYCWCVFNRVDNKDYPDTLEEVINQPQQWMRYDAENPVLEELYQIAREQLEAWHNGDRRPVSSEYVFMNWTPSDLCLRNNWTEGSGTRYWRYGK